MIDQQTEFPTTAAERLLDMGRLLRSKYESARYIQLVDQTCPIDANVIDEFKLALDLHRFVEQYPGRAFNAIVEAWPMQRIHLELY